MKESIDSILQIFSSNHFLFHYNKKGVLHLRGKESFKFLNGISSNEIKYTEANFSTNTLILTIKGRILYDIEIYANNGDELYILHDTDQRIDLLEYLKKYRMSYKIDIIDLNDSFKVFKGGDIKNDFEILEFKSAQILEENFKVFLEPLKNNNMKNFESTDQNSYDLWRLLMGIPTRGSELTSKTIPIEANMWSSISFTKGCYIGQETIARIHYRGKVKRNLACLMIPQLITKNSQVFNYENKLIGELCNYFYFKEDKKTYALAYIDTEENFKGNKITVEEIASEITNNSYKNQNERLLKT